jgi:hypothetical protein
VQSFTLNSSLSTLHSPLFTLHSKSFLLTFFILSQLAIINSQLAIAQSTPTAFTQEDRDRMIRTETRLDEGFKQIDKRFEQTDTYMGWMIALFGGMFATTIIFALWDRRSMIRPFETKVKDIENQMELLKSDKTNTSILSSLRELAKTDSKLADILKMHNLL